MLKLELKNGESIQFGENVIVKFDKVTQSRIKVLIDAPKEIQIRRVETKKSIVEMR